MFPDVLEEFKSYFGRSFFLGVFFPVLIFTGASVALYFEITQGLGTALAAWGKLALQAQILSLLGSLVIALVLAYLIYNFQEGLNRLFEGHWSRIPGLNWLRNQRTKLYEDRWKYLNALMLDAPMQKERFSQVEREGIGIVMVTYYPPQTHLDSLMPTRLGNIHRNVEFYAKDRYGMSLEIIWPRLRPLLTEEVLAPLESSKTTRGFMQLMTVLAGTFALIWCPVLAIFTNRWLLFLLCALGLPLARVCYLSALQSSLAYSERMKALIDLHRCDLFKALNRRTPLPGPEEMKEWKNLELFFHRNKPISHAPPDPDKPQSLDQVVTALAEYLKKVNPPTT